MSPSTKRSAATVKVAITQLGMYTRPRAGVATTFPTVNSPFPYCFRTNVEVAVYGDITMSRGVPTRFIVPCASVSIFADAGPANASAATSRAVVAVRRARRIAMVAPFRRHRSPHRVPCDFGCLVGRCAPRQVALLCQVRDPKVGRGAGGELPSQARSLRASRTWMSPYFGCHLQH